MAYLQPFTCLTYLQPFTWLIYNLLHSLFTTFYKHLYKHKLQLLSKLGSLVYIFTILKVGNDQIKFLE
jgi:hypothetical protein